MYTQCPEARGGRKHPETAGIASILNSPTISLVPKRQFILLLKCSIYSLCCLQWEMTLLGYLNSWCPNGSLFGKVIRGGYLLDEEPELYELCSVLAGPWFLFHFLCYLMANHASYSYSSLFSAVLLNISSGAVNKNIPYTPSGCFWSWPFLQQEQQKYNLYIDCVWVTNFLKTHIVIESPAMLNCHLLCRWFTGKKKAGILLGILLLSS